MDKKMSPEQRQAKMDVLQELMEAAQEKMGETVKSGMDSMKKVSVAAPDMSSLKEGLQVAENILPEENINPEVDELTPDEDVIVSEPSELEATEKIDASMDDDDDDIFAKKRKKSRFQELTSDEE